MVSLALWTKRVCWKALYEVDHSWGRLSLWVAVLGKPRSCLLVWGTWSRVPLTGCRPLTGGRNLQKAAPFLGGAHQWPHHSGKEVELSPWASLCQAHHNPSSTDRLITEYVWYNLYRLDFLTLPASVLATSLVCGCIMISSASESPWALFPDLYADAHISVQRQLHGTCKMPRLGPLLSTEFSPQLQAHIVSPDCREWQTIHSVVCNCVGIVGKRHLHSNQPVICCLPRMCWVSQPVEASLGPTCLPRENREPQGSVLPSSQSLEELGPSRPRLRWHWRMSSLAQCAQSTASSWRWQATTFYFNDNFAVARSALNLAKGSAQVPVCPWDGSVSPACRVAPFISAGPDIRKHSKGNTKWYWI